MITRRKFLKLSGLTLGSLSVLPFIKNLFKKDDWMFVGYNDDGWEVWRIGDTIHIISTTSEILRIESIKENAMIVSRGY